MYWKLYLYRGVVRAREIEKPTQADIYALMCSNDFVQECRAQHFTAWEMRQEHPHK